MTMVGWFLMAAFALVASVSLWWAQHLQRENDRLRAKNFRLEQEHREEIEFAHRAFRDFSPQDPATILSFPDERREA